MDYRIIEPADTVKDAKIEKLGVVVTFTMRDVEAHEEMLRKLRQELNAKRDVEKAKKGNIERNHPFVLTMTPQDLFTADMYQDARTQFTAADEKLAEVERQLADYATEKAEIVKQIPELANEDLEDNEQA